VLARAGGHAERVAPHRQIEEQHRHEPGQPHDRPHGRPGDDPALRRLVLQAQARHDRLGGERVDREAEQADELPDERVLLGLLLHTLRGAATEEAHDQRRHHHDEAEGRDGRRERLRVEQALPCVEVAVAGEREQRGPQPGDVDRRPQHTRSEQADEHHRGHCQRLPSRTFVAANRKTNIMLR
jgi:hypothetical protein